MGSVGRVGDSGNARGSRARTVPIRTMRGRDDGSMVLNDAQIESSVSTNAPTVFTFRFIAPELSLIDIPISVGLAHE